ncbi:Phage-like element PBSX protein, XkdF [uncultured Caudovirales phage]|uniref:Phage-like element PBSX protein, XkdF n=1 Tax=uncultured Caudovirales phage TaxID=2100421 RepID=A0A6J5R8N4_9CAUD|nr:Phage-like element PBSX protein, XkdF [uncultured Caudovirales phage]CAB4176270.1 Phage-like element PBSX protein, XkdF [uncultured Caudovirales phage]CAB4190916.1 Phage-like element PBSX protein, XkdF [uncultured Caudovirales phage]CAB4223375.1 Phage-like element PBSX protein, XkdF [uncultured Caudovirales phage]CAB5220530.1 Phage-like element PBSX protein, XkdF [uncultured Caudovirales phage]
MVAVPSFMSANAKRGLKLLEYAGDGLQPKTIREARAMASGDITAEKVRRVAAWLARHIVDLDSPKADDYLENRSDRPTPGQVAWLLWGGDIGKAQRGRAEAWANRKRDQLIAEGELTKAVSDSVRDGLKQKVKDNNEGVTDKSKMVTLSMLEQVFERGVGAYNTNPASVRPTVSSPEQWAYARVNVFLGAVRTGKYKRGKFDTDLLPEGHPLKSEKKEKNMSEVHEAMHEEYGYSESDMHPEDGLAPILEGLIEHIAASYSSAKNALKVFTGDTVEAETCPVATQDVAVNLKNRQAAIDGAHYGPLNPAEPNEEFWTGIANRWDTSIEQAKKQRCGNCAAFIRTPAMLDCIDQGLGNETSDDAMSVIDAGDLGYCEAWDFKCAGSRTCDAWIVGGPITGEDDDNDQTADDDSAEEDSAESVAAEPVSGTYGTRTMVQRVIEEQDGQYCVVSETGRAFGCYTSRDQADSRLAQIERFTSDRLAKASSSELIAWHTKAHEVLVVSKELKIVHDALEDEIELRGYSRPYEISPDEKLSLLVDRNTEVVAKAHEQRYTLGPWYVPDMEDAHGEFTDSETLQKALWEWVRKGDRTIYLQHSQKPAGEMVEIMTVPFPVEADLKVPNQGTTKFKFPAETPFMGVVWEPWAWEMVKAGTLRGYSIGGTAKRMTVDLP